MAGSSCHMLKCMNHLHSLSVLSIEDMMQVSYYNALAILKMKPEDLSTKPMLAYAAESGFQLIGSPRL
jgi:hypothetical protein